MQKQEERSYALVFFTTPLSVEYACDVLDGTPLFGSKIMYYNTFYCFRVKRRESSKPTKDFAKIPDYVHVSGEIEPQRYSFIAEKVFLFIFFYFVSSL